MAINIDKRCKVCKIIDEGDTALLKRLYGSSHFKGRAGETLTKILTAYEGQFTRQSLSRHLKNHQALNEEDLKANVRDKIVQNQTTKIIQEAVNHNSARQLVIEKGYKALKGGKIKVSARDLLQATKQAADIEEKQKDRSVKITEMIMAFASGEIMPSGHTPSGDPETSRSYIANSA